MFRDEQRSDPNNWKFVLLQPPPGGKGLFFDSYCHSPKPFEIMLNSMIHGDGHGNSDHLLKYTQAETGSAFFAPSLSFLAQLTDIDK